MRVLNIGSLNLDYVYNLDHIVQPGETEASYELNVHLGGKGMNQSCALAKAGVEPRLVWRNMGDIAKAALADPCCVTNPVRVDDFVVRRILEEVTGRV